MTVTTRSYNRSADQLRPLSMERGFTRYAEGSVLISCGDTKVLCNASVEDGVPPFMRGQGRGWVTAEYSMLPRATVSRNSRESTKGKVAGRTHEIQRLIGRSLRAVVDFELLGERTIRIDCDVLQADGGTRTASITGAYIALADAVNKLLASGSIADNPLADSVCAISVGMVNGQPLLDLDYSEDSSADVDMNIVMTGSGKFVEIQGTAEAVPFSCDQFDQMRKLAMNGCREITSLQRQIMAG